MNKAAIGSFSAATTLRESLALVAVLLVAVIVRFSGLTESLWFDEVWYTQTTFAQPDMLAEVLWKDVHPPAYPLLLMAWTDLFGDSEIAVRMPSFLCGLASIVLLWFIARRWMGQFKALLAIALVALSPPHIWYSYENKVNMMVLLLTMAAVWLFWRAGETRRTNDWIVATIVLIVALYTHSYAVPVAAAIFMWLGWRALRDHSLIKPLLISGFVIALVFTPLVLVKFGHRSDLARGYLRQFSPVEIYKLLFIWLPSGNTFRTGNPNGPFSRLIGQPWPYFLIEAFYAFVFLRGLLVVGRRAHGNGWLKPVSDPATTEPARLVLLWMFMPLLLTVAGSVFSENFYIERNLLVILPPFVLLLVAGADIGSPRWVKSLMFAVLVILAAAATINLRYFTSETWTVYKYKPDWRAATNYLADEAKPGGLPRVLVTVPTFAYQYYQRRNHSGPVPASKTSAFAISVCSDDPEKTLNEITRLDWPDFYLVRDKTWGGCWNDIWNLIPTEPSLHLVDQKEFKGLTIYKFSIEK